jgi:hypothetical protein
LTRARLNIKDFLLGSSRFLAYNDRHCRELTDSDKRVIGHLDLAWHIYNKANGREKNADTEVQGSNLPFPVKNKKDAGSRWSQRLSLL